MRKLCTGWASLKRFRLLFFERRSKLPTGYPWVYRYYSFGAERGYTQVIRSLQYFMSLRCHCGISERAVVMQAITKPKMAADGDSIGLVV